MDGTFGLLRQPAEGALLLSLHSAALVAASNNVFAKFYDYTDDLDGQSSETDRNFLNGKAFNSSEGPGNGKS